MFVGIPAPTRTASAQKWTLTSQRHPLCLCLVKDAASDVHVEGFPGLSIEIRLKPSPREEPRNHLFGSSMPIRELVHKLLDRFGQEAIDSQNDKSRIPVIQPITRKPEEP